jgi:hypothetical protein
MIHDLGAHMNARAQSYDTQSEVTEEPVTPGFIQETTVTVKKAEFERDQNIFSRPPDMMFWFLCGHSLQSDDRLFD